MVEGISYLSSFVSVYQDLDVLWHQPYAIFSGNCPIYRFVFSLQVLAFFDGFALFNDVFRTYETLDNKFVAVGALEEKFSSLLFRSKEMNLIAYKKIHSKLLNSYYIVFSNRRC